MGSQLVGRGRLASVRATPANGNGACKIHGVPPTVCRPCLVEHLQEFRHANVRAGIRGKLAVVKREIAEIQAQEKPTTGNPGLFGQHSPSHPGLCALQDRKLQLEHVVKLLEGELRGK